MAHYFQFGDFNTDNFPADGVGLRVGAVNVYNAAPQNIEAYNIPGRIGEYLPENAEITYSNEIREYMVALYMRNRTPEQVKNALADLRAALMPYMNKYESLVDSYEPGFKRNAYFTGEFMPERMGARNNFQIPIRFSCDPRRFLWPTQIESIPSGTVSVSITNPTNYPAHPLLTVGGCGAPFSISFIREDSSVAGSIQFKAFPNTLDISFDCETTNAIRLGAGNVTANDLISAVNGELTLVGTTRIQKTNASASVGVSTNFWTR